MYEYWDPYDASRIRAIRPASPGGYARSPSRPASRKTGGFRKRHFFVFVLLWLGMLLWPAPQLGALLAQQTTQAAHTVVASASTALGGPVRDMATNLSPAAPSNSGHTYWQIGVAAAGAPDNARGMRAAITTVVPQKVSKNTTNYYWLGTYLSDGSFIQAGYYVPSYDQAHAGWFYCAFTPSGKEGPCAYGPSGSAGGNATTHTYTLRAASVAGAAAHWQVLLDGRVIGTFAWTSDNTGANAPVLYAESSGFTAHGADSMLGPVDFPQGLAVEEGSRYISMQELRAVYSSADVCPPYGIARDGHGGVLIGSGLPCPGAWARV